MNMSQVYQFLINIYIFGVSQPHDGFRLHRLAVIGRITGLVSAYANPDTRRRKNLAFAVGFLGGEEEQHFIIHRFRMRSSTRGIILHGYGKDVGDISRLSRPPSHLIPILTPSINTTLKLLDTANPPPTPPP